MMHVKKNKKASQLNHPPLKELNSIKIHENPTRRSGLKKKHSYPFSYYSHVFSSFFSDQTPPLLNYSFTKKDFYLSAYTIYLSFKNVYYR